MADLVSQNRLESREALLTATAIALAADFLLGGYEFIRSPTNTLFKAIYGKEELPFVMAGIPIAVAVALYAYGRMLSRMGPRRTLFWTSLGSVALITLGQVAFDAGFKPAIVFLYLFRSAYVVLLIEQYWSFLNSVLSVAAAKKLNGPICGVASVGGILAGVAGSQLTASFGTTAMVFFAAAVTLPAAFLSDWAYRRQGEPVHEYVAPEPGAKKDHLALGLFKTSPLLVLLLTIVILTQVIAAVLALSFQGVLQDVIPDPDTQTAYSFSFYAWLNGFAAIAQFLLAPLLLRFVKPAIVHVAIPLVHVSTCVVFLGAPSLETMAFAYIAFKCIDYSIFRAAKELLYMPLAFDARYRAKEVIDVFEYRSSKGVTAFVISGLQRLGLVFVESTYAAIALGFAALWALLSVFLGKHYETKVKSQDVADTLANQKMTSIRRDSADYERATTKG